MNGGLEFLGAVEGFGAVGGLANLKAWLRLRKEGFSQRARAFGLPYPRGVLLVGVPGCGKSLCAKAVAAEWKKPLLKFHLGRVFGSLVGESEERMRRALAVAEGVAPAILWIDELEKGLSATSGGDSGVATRVFGTLLTWMEERQKPVFVVATANAKMPPALLDMLDENFFVDLPGPTERAEILMIHLARMGRDPSEFDLPALVRATHGFNGAELEYVVVSALYEAFAERKAQAELRLGNGHLLKAAAQLVPLSRTRQRQIEDLRAWAAQNCRPAAHTPAWRDSLPPSIQ
jgi:SpoVK/Ycf46/Vps4 family AAA+-type ATPase